MPLSATSGHLSLPLSPPGLSFPWPPGLSRSRSCLWGSSWPLPGRSTDSARWWTAGSLLPAWPPEPAARDAGGRLLADHPVTGGYPVIGVVHPDDVPRCAQVRPGEQVRFTPDPG